MKDHLGNVRVSFTADPQPESYIATMETGDRDENKIFFHIPKAKDQAILNKTPGGDEVMALNNTNSVGANYFKEVMPGDEIDVSVWAAYESGSKFSNTFNTAAMINLVATSFTGITKVLADPQTVLNAISSAVNKVPFAGTGSATEPAAYLNYYVFDKNLNFEYGGFKKTVNGNQGIMKQFTTDVPIKIEKPGYILVFLSNESNASQRVFFDELKVTLTRPVIQADDYYPFGLTIAEMQYQNPGMLENKFKYNGVEVQPDFGLNTYQTLFRTYDPAIGRFQQIDPLADFMPGINSYNFGFNNPISFADPDGLMGKKPPHAPNLWDRIKNFFVKDNPLFGRRLNPPSSVKVVGTNYNRRSRGSSNSSSNNSNSNNNNNEQENDPPQKHYYSINYMNPIEPSEREYMPMLPEVHQQARRQTSSLVMDDGTVVPVDARTRINFNHSPFGGNSSAIADDNRTNAFLAPIAQFLQANPDFAVTIFVGTNLANPNQIINMNGGTNNGTVNQLINQRGAAIQRALLNMGVNPNQVVFAGQTGRRNNIFIRFRNRLRNR